MRCISRLIVTLVNFGGRYYRDTTREGTYPTHSYIREYLADRRVMFSLLSSVNWNFVMKSRMCLNLAVMESGVTVNRADIRTSPFSVDILVETVWRGKPNIRVKIKVNFIIRKTSVH